MTDLATIPNNQTTAIARAAAAALAAQTNTLVDRAIDELSKHSQRALKDDLAMWNCYIEKTTEFPTSENWFEHWKDLANWQGINGAFVDGFCLWQLSQGYARKSILRRLASVRKMAILAHQAGVITSDELAKIKAVRVSRQDANSDSAANFLDREQLKKLLDLTTQPNKHPTTNEKKLLHGKRDRLIILLFVYHILRLDELCTLQVSNFDVKKKHLTFYRSKKRTRSACTHKLSPQTWQAFTAYRDASRKMEGMALFDCSKSTVQRVIQHYGELIGVPDLSPHDLRHTGARLALEAGTPINQVQSWGGWASPSMVLYYAKANEIANKGVDLGLD